MAEVINTTLKEAHGTLSKATPLVGEE